MWAEPEGAARIGDQSQLIQPRRAVLGHRSLKGQSPPEIPESGRSNDAAIGGMICLRKGDVDRLIIEERNLQKDGRRRFQACKQGAEVILLFSLAVR